jgi:gamma-glutamyltranspeptidase/glutathione hydrolase
VPVGEIFRHPEMAATLRGVAAEGPDYMITGRWAERFVVTANRIGWPIEMRHMTATPPRWIAPLRFAHHEYEVISLAPPEQQGVLCAIVLGILSRLGIREVAPLSPEHIFDMAHALRYGLYHCGFIGDPVVSDYAVVQLVDGDFHRMAARMIEGMRPKLDLSEHVQLTSGPGEATFVNPTAGEPTGAIGEPPSAGSCELSIVDAAGNWAQTMTTLQSGGIPGMAVDGVPMVGSHAGFGGLTGWMDTRIVEGARSRCVIGNTIVLKGGKPAYSLGTPGNCFCSVPQVLAYLLDFRLVPYDAVDAPRMLPLAEDGSVTIEDRLSPALRCCTQSALSRTF